MDFSEHLENIGFGQPSDRPANTVGEAQGNLQSAAPPPPPPEDNGLHDQEDTATTSSNNNNQKQQPRTSLGRSSAMHLQQAPMDNHTSYLNKDEPIAAVYVARKLFCDFVQLVNKKIETILANEARDKCIYKPLQLDEDPTYSRLLEAIESISEFCLPSLLRNSLAWYQSQLGPITSDHLQQQQQEPVGSSKRASSLSECPLHLQHQEQLLSPQQSQSLTRQHTNLDLLLNSSVGSRVSPCPDTLASMSSTTIRSPTPSSPDTSNQVSILSAFASADAQSPSLNLNLNQSPPTPANNTLDPNANQQSSTANTSTSTATNVSSNSLTEDITTATTTASTTAPTTTTTTNTTANTLAHLELIKTRKLLIEYAFCQILLKIFTQLHLHPGHTDLISQVMDIAFEHFRCIDEPSNLAANDLMNINRLADKFAEVIGLLARTRFKAVRKRFMLELNELKSIKEPTPHNIQCIVTLLPGLKYFRVKMAPIEEFQQSFHFLQEFADYFIEVRHKSIRHALAGLFVEIMSPLATSVRNEVKIPCLKTFIDTLWLPTFEMCSRKKHSITLFPLVTCLLCLSQRNFFLSNWQAVLNLCLSNLKNRDQKMCRIAFESLYRLIWTYMDRIKCESNVITQTRLTTIMEALFPKGGRSIVPRAMPISMFIDIIRFIGQERLDFAMKHIIFDLLSVDRPFKVITAPERMYIGLKAFLVIVDGLQQKESDPSMLLLSGAGANGQMGYSSVRKIQSNRILTDEVARAIGISPFHSQIQRSFNDILKALDSQLGKPLLLNRTSAVPGKDLDESASAERRTKLDLFKACLQALPRLIPEGMSRQELVELLSRLTIHVDEDMRKCAVHCLETLVGEFPDWRLDTIEGFTRFLGEQIDDTHHRHLVEGCLRTLAQLLSSWHAAITLNSCSQTGPGTSSAPPLEQSSVRSCGSTSSITIQTGYETISTRNTATGGQVVARKNRALAEMRLIQSELSNTPYERLVNAIQRVEGALFIMLCSCQPASRRLASHLLRETRAIIKCYSGWCCMEQLNFKTPEDGGENLGAGPDETPEDLSTVSLKGSLSADNLSRISATSGAPLGLASSVASMSTPPANYLSAASVSRMCLAGSQRQASSANARQASNAGAQQRQQQQHRDAYDSDSEQNLRDSICAGDNSGLIFWTSMIMLESDNEQEFTFALRLLANFVPSIPFEQASFIEELELNLKRIGWNDFPGLHALVLKGCLGPNYALAISLLDSLTPSLLHPICSTTSSANSNIFPLHTLVLLTQLLADYDDPSALSLNIARRLAIWCDVNQPAKLENLSAVMTLYSRRCFSKDGFQWTKCVIKYLYDAYPDSLHSVIPLLVDLLEGGPRQVRRLIPPILYCILNYIDVTSTNLSQSLLNAELARLYNRLLLEAASSSPNHHHHHHHQATDGHLVQAAADSSWRDAVQIFKLIISRSSSLDVHASWPATAAGGRELPGRTLDFSVDLAWFQPSHVAASPGAPQQPINQADPTQWALLGLQPAPGGAGPTSGAAAGSPLSGFASPSGGGGPHPASTAGAGHLELAAAAARRPASWLPAASGRFRLSFVGRVGACASLARSSLPA